MAKDNESDAEFEKRFKEGLEKADKEAKKSEEDFKAWMNERW
ncbi:hypothetical protein [Nocardiopsis dassonvillei]|nr:hypothetical protein [Nocardiopsis dassonvillei]